MFVRNWMSAPPVTIPRTVPVQAALAFMEKRRIRRLPVVENDRLVGIVTKSDLSSARGKELAVEDVMAKRPISVAPDETLERAAQLMLQKKISGLPVVEDKKLVGIITESDVFRALCEILGLSEAGARVVLTVPESGDLLGTIGSRLNGLALRSLATYHNSAAGRWEVVIRVRGRAAKR
jgi:acetoin utilization protein AcuB